MSEHPYLDVYFPAEMSRYSNCICDMCFKTDYVIKMKLPCTRYHNNRALSTKYSETWICESCRDKLVEALKMEYPQRRYEGTELRSREDSLNGEV